MQESIFGNIEDESFAQKRAKELRELIRKYDNAYYLEAESLISDIEYDALFKELSEIEKNNPELISKDSPTQRVGGAPLKEFASVTRAIPMLSLQNTYTQAELVDFDRRVRDGLGNEIPQYYCELKFDGVAFSASFENGTLSLGATRGDGATGDDITQNIKTIKNLPLKVESIDSFEIRGEAYMDEADFLALNEKRELAGEKTFANPRNLTAGTLKLLDPKEVAKRPLKLVAYWFNSERKSFETHKESLEYIKSLGFPISPYSRLCETMEDVFAFIDEWKLKRYELPFQIDGVVIKLNSFRQRLELGEISRFPRWAIAFKYPAEQAKTLLREITIQIGRTGAATPVAELVPVKLAGSTISRATLNNADYISELDIRIGDTLIIEKGGEVIPKIVGVDLSARPADAEIYSFPELCPCAHNYPLKRIEGEANHYCENPECPWQIRKRIEHFSGRDAMDIAGLGEKAVDVLVSNNLLTNIADIFELSAKRDELLGVERWGEKSVDNLLSAIEECKNKPFEKILYALGIRFVGARGAKILAKNFADIWALSKATLEELTALNEIGERIAESIVEFFSIDDNIALIKRLDARGVKLAGEIKTNLEEQIFEGLTFVLTGELDGMTRNEASEIIERLGGKASSSVSKKTSYVLSGANAGSKLQKAQDLGVKILSKEDFLELAKIN